MKKYVDKVLLKKKNSTLFGIYVHFGLSLKLVWQEHLKIFFFFLDVSLVFFFLGRMMHVRKAVFCKGCICYQKVVRL